MTGLNGSVPEVANIVQEILAAVISDAPSVPIPDEVDEGDLICVPETDDESELTSSKYEDDVCVPETDDEEDSACLRDSNRQGSVENTANIASQISNLDDTSEVWIPKTDEDEDEGKAGTDSEEDVENDVAEGSSATVAAQAGATADPIAPLAAPVPGPSQLTRLPLMFIFDWDDTLYPTSLHMRDRQSLRSPEVRAQLATLERVLLELFTVCQRKGEVRLISNAALSWVLGTAERYMPRFSDYMRSTGLVVISAREERVSDDHDDWKYPVFKREIRNWVFFEKIFNLLSVGDGEPERRAITRLAEDFPIARVKGVRFIERPSIDSLITQLRFLLTRLDSLCEMELSIVEDFRVIFGGSLSVLMDD